ncbi:ADP-glucose pyrophosphorylase [Rubellimicrobium rubrum]|uniref:ADP-glucose pyrophosphorylase n=1 Tax=Rubellimicrobium rubrum TaxID=2585369 RepID=A0A5C4MVN5_9RHOB|nr:sugar phosphate nucleotidyltransferase [Rubellimicrobium rubrum]TNC48743.1 ADP-glucose pyrophosphorylase [Rubellimicrobium rubrum]
MARLDDLDLSKTLAVLLAGGSGSRLHELSDLEAKPALPLAEGRLVDFAIGGAVRAGVPRLSALLGHRPETLTRHIPARWGDRIAVTLPDTPVFGPQGTMAALLRMPQDDAQEFLVLPGDQVHDLDLRALVGAHRHEGSVATFAASGDRRGPCVFDAAWLRASAATDLGRDIWEDLLPALAAAGKARAWTVPADAYWRDIDTLDDLRLVSLDFQRGWPCITPPGESATPLVDDPRELAFEAGGISLSVPRFGARTPGRWTVLEDTVVMPGARVAPGARLTRALVAPGAIVPAGLVLGDDPEEDARWFRVTPLGTSLVTPPMLAARAADRMRARLQSRSAGLATSGRL